MLTVAFLWFIQSNQDFVSSVLNFFRKSFFCVRRKLNLIHLHCFWMVAEISEGNLKSSENKTKTLPVKIYFLLFEEFWRFEIHFLLLLLLLLLLLSSSSQEQCFVICSRNLDSHLCALSVCACDGQEMYPLFSWLHFLASDVWHPHEFTVVLVCFSFFHFRLVSRRPRGGWWWPRCIWEQVSWSRSWWEKVVFECVFVWQADSLIYVFSFGQVRTKASKHGRVPNN